MTTTTDTAIPTAVQAAKARIDTAIDALLALRSLVHVLPDIADRIAFDGYAAMRINIYVGNAKYTPTERRIDVPARIAEIAETAARHGATLHPDVNGTYGGVRATFGPFELYIYAPLDQVGTSAVREVTEWQLDERLTAFGTETSK